MTLGRSLAWGLALVACASCQALLDLGSNDVGAGVDGGEPLADATSDAPLGFEASIDGGPAFVFEVEGIDPAFNGGSVVTIESWHAAVKLAVDATRIYVGGRAGPRADTLQPSFFSVAALKHDGTLEPAFADGGLVTLVRAQDTDDELEDVDLDPQGRVLLSGVARVVDQRPFVGLAKVAATGALDPTFADAGWLVTRLPDDEQAEPRAAAVDGMGRIFVAGRVQVASDREWELMTLRVSAEGLPNTVYNRRDLADDDGLFGCTVDESSTITAVGWRKSKDDPTEDGVIVRFLPSGNYDTTWGDTDAGRSRLTLPSGHDRGYDVAVTSDGRTIVVGSYDSDAIGFVVGLTADGSLDTTFGPGIDNFRPWGLKLGSIARAITLDGSGRALVVGTKRVSGENAAGFVARLTLDGRLDASFGGTGADAGIRRVATIDGDVSIGAVRVLPSGKIVIAGAATRGAGVARGFVTSMLP